MADCKCPAGFRYHAGNCPVAPDAIRNVALDEKCKEQEARFVRFRRSLQVRRAHSTDGD